MPKEKTLGVFAGLCGQAWQAGAGRPQAAPELIGRLTAKEAADHDPRKQVRSHQPTAHKRPAGDQQGRYRNEDADDNQALRKGCAGEQGTQPGPGSCQEGREMCE